MMRELSIGWRPTPAQQAIIDGLDAKTDKVECIILFYCVSHDGNGPALSEIAKALGFHKHTTERYVNDLIGNHRARRLDGKLSLILASYDHPLLHDPRIRALCDERHVDEAA